jgi:3D (Asp-Asp-Asp) domain-containing protein
LAHIRLKGLLALGSAALSIGYLGPVGAPNSPSPASPKLLAAVGALPVEPERVARSSPAAVPFATREVLDPNLPAGAAVVESEGAPGREVVFLEDRIEDGRVVSERETGERLLAAPVVRVVRKGAGPAALAAPGSRVARSFVTRDATAYCLTGRTATGTRAGPGAVAVDPTVIPLGSRLYVEGYGFGDAVDTGGGIRGLDVDLWMTCPAAVRWGRRTVRVYVLQS